MELYLIHVQRAHAHLTQHKKNMGLSSYECFLPVPLDCYKNRKRKPRLWGSHIKCSLGEELVGEGGWEGNLM